MAHCIGSVAQCFYIMLCPLDAVVPSFLKSANIVLQWQHPWGSQQCLSNHTRETFCEACSCLLQAMPLHSGVRHMSTSQHSMHPQQMQSTSCTRHFHGVCESAGATSQYDIMQRQCHIQSCKSCCFSPAGHIPPYSAPLIDMYKQANGIILGKMNLAELSTSIGSINPNIPGNNITTPLNPYNQTKIPGGDISLHVCTTAACSFSNDLLAAASSTCLLQLCAGLHKQRNLVCVY